MTFQGLIWGVVSVMLFRAEADTVTQKKAVEVAGNVTLSCVLPGSYDILQVTWQKKNTGGNNENLATYNTKNGVNIPVSYQGRLNFTRLSLNDTAITLWGVRIQDDGCYVCLFNTFPVGVISQDTCFTVYEKLRGYLHYTVSEGSLTATCSANAWPRPVISWIVPNAEGEKTEEVVTHPNGTESVISTLHVNSSTSLIGQELICRVRHMEEDSNYHVKVKEADTVTQKKAVEVGGNVTLSCVLPGSYDILQVTWQKKNTGGNDENLATYNTKNGVNIPVTYQGRLNFTRLSLNDTAITLWGVRIQDDGCYVCLFNTFPGGAIQQDTCFTVYEKLRGYLHYTVSEGSLTATCSANAWPRPVISWIVPNAEGEKTEEVVTHPNGTESVISTLHVNSSTSLIGQELICRVRHMEEDSDYHVKVKKGWCFSIPGLLALVALVVILLVLTVGIVYWRRRRKKQSGSRTLNPSPGFIPGQT